MGIGDKTCIILYILILGKFVTSQTLDHMLGMVLYMHVALPMYLPALYILQLFGGPGGEGFCPLNS